MLDQITPLIITYNESANMARTLDALHWAKRIVVVDSFSTDGTLEVLRLNPRVEVLQRHFTTFADQCNFGLHHVHTRWVLSLDADYLIDDALVSELRMLRPGDDCGGYEACFRYCIHGRPLRGSLYPPRIVLHRAAGSRYEDDGHGHGVRVAGKVQRLRAKIHHDDRKPLCVWFANQWRYADQEAAKLRRTPGGELSRTDRIRKRIFLAPWLVLFYCLIVRRGLLDGRAGWHYALQRLIAEVTLSLRLLDLQLGGSGNEHPRN